MSAGFTVQELLVCSAHYPRYLLEYLDKKTKTLQDANAVAAWLMCCVKCCAWCLEKIVAYINHNAYIIIGLKGTSYCSAAMRAIELIITVRDVDCKLLVLNQNTKLIARII
jgi:choline transporter-like protein 2/4/5